MEEEKGEKLVRFGVKSTREKEGREGTTQEEENS
jgi:hypothetical protein